MIAPMAPRQDVLVVGAGVIGLSSAIALVDRGHRVRILARDRTPGTTSDRAGAKFTPFGVGGVGGGGGAGEGGRELAWARESWRAFAEIAGDARNAVVHGVRFTRAIEFVGDPAQATPWWADLAPDFRPLSLAPTHRAHGFAAGFEALVPHMDIARYMPWLERECLRRGVAIEARTIRSWHDLASERFDATINCTGLGSRSLADDPLMVPMRGQMLRVENTTHLDFSIVADRPAPAAPWGGTGVPPVRAASGPSLAPQAIAYIFTFPTHLILGGTFEPGVADDATDASDLDAIVERCRTLARLAGHEPWARIGERRERTWAGIRPARLRGDTHELIENIRLERDALPDGRPLIHNYGHGRAGITYSWGCAANVVELIERP